MDTLEYGVLLKVFLSLGVVLALMYSLSHFLKTKMTLKSSLKIIERHAIDHKRQLLTIERNQKQYILLLSPAGDVLIDTLPIPHDIPETLP